MCLNLLSDCESWWFHFHWENRSKVAMACKFRNKRIVLLILCVKHRDTLSSLLKVDKNRNCLHEHQKDWKKENTKGNAERDWSLGSLRFALCVSDSSVAYHTDTFSDKIWCSIFIGTGDIINVHLRERLFCRTWDCW